VENVGAVIDGLLANTGTELGGGVATYYRRESDHVIRSRGWRDKVIFAGLNERVCHAGWSEKNGSLQRKQYTGWLKTQHKHSRIERVWKQLSAVSRPPLGYLLVQSQSSRYARE